MTLIPCPECSRAVSSAALQCPGCGQPLQGPEPGRRRRRDRVLPLVIGGAVLASVLGYTGVWMAASRFDGGHHHVTRTIEVTRVVAAPTPPPMLTVIEGTELVQPPPAPDLPELLNTAEVSRMAARTYPPLLRDAGIGGVASVRLRVMSNGSPDTESMTVESSTHEAFSEAALRVAERMRFRPARHGGEHWVTIPISFHPVN